MWIKIESMKCSANNKAYESAQDALAADENMIVRPVYIFAERFAGDATINGYDAEKVVYVDRDSATVKIGRKAVTITKRLYGCGVNAVDCAFVA